MRDDLKESFSFAIGELVQKDAGDYRFIGKVVSLFKKLDGVSIRYVVENGDGVLHIFNGAQLRHIVDRPFRSEQSPKLKTGSDDPNPDPESDLGAEPGPSG